MDEFAAFVAGGDWDLALLQEAPPRWFERLCREAQASGVLARTSRNQLAPLRAWLADRRPDLIASGEGGSNQILVRGMWRVVARRRMTLAWLPERRRMLWVRLERADPPSRGAGDAAALCVATLHASAHRPARAAREVERAAGAAAEWSAGAPLVFGGDFNVRPVEEPWLFERLAGDYGFTGKPSGEHRIDHLLAHGLDLGGDPRTLPHAAGGLVLSDHDPLVAQFVG